MANNPTMVQHSANLLNALNFYHRNGQYPLDDTSVWSTVADFDAYLSESGSYRYPGQLVAITNGDAYDSENNKDVSLVVVRSDGSKQVVGTETIHASVDAANAWVTANPNVAVAGKILSVAKDSSYELYVIKADKSLARVSFDVSDVPEVTWANLKDKPTSLVTEIDAAVALSKKLTESDGTLAYDSKVLAFKSEIPTTYEAAKITGVISIDNLPAGALERLIHVDNETARFALTTAQVQLGDTVMQDDTGAMYLVKDDSNLSSEEGYQQYTAGAASSVPWSGITNKPTTVAASGLTDAVATGDLSETGVAGKAAVYNSEGKLSATAADADKLGGQLPSYYATAAALEQEATDRTNAVKGVDDKVTALTTRVGDAETDIDNLETSVSNINTEITNIKNGDTITQLAASKLTGIVSRDNLPTDVGGKTVTVASEDAKRALTTDNINLGDLVQVTGGALYMYNNAAGIGTDDGFVKLVDITGGDIQWSQIKSTPTTLSGYGITDAVNVSDTSDTAVAGKVVKYNGDGKVAGDITGDAATLGGHAASYFATKSEFDILNTKVGNSASGIIKDIADLQSGETIQTLAASKLTGTISLDNLPKTVVERLSIVTDENALLALSIDDVQNGDSVKVTSTGKMYFVKDDSKLGQMVAFEEYTVGTAGAVDWSGVKNKPTTLSGYGITDAVNVSEKVSTASAANAGKILVLNAEGKLDVSITGNVAWANVLNKPTSTVTEIDEAVAAATHTNRAVLDKLTDVDGRLTYNGTGLATKPELDAVSVNTLLQSDAEPENATTGQMWLEPIRT